MKTILLHSKKQVVWGCLLAALVFLLAACDIFPPQGNKASGTPTSSATPTPSPGVGLGSQTCPAGVGNASHWNAIIPVNPSQMTVGSVTCANIKGIPRLQALVNVNITGTGNIINIYVYDNITDPHPQQIFKQEGLYKGDAKVSAYNTILTAQVDQTSPANQKKPNGELMPDLFREFKWSDGAGTFVPITFSGIYPSATRYQAEADQQQANQGHQPWMLNPSMVANTLAASMLRWSPNATTTVVSGGGQHDVDAVVNVKSISPGNNTITVTMSRLEGNANGGIWIVTNVTSNGMAITSPQSLSLVSSPIAVAGKGEAFEGIVGTVNVLDQHYNNIGHVPAIGTIGNGNTPFNATVPYTLNSKSGPQEGILTLYSISSADGSISGAVMVKVMLNV